VENDCAIVGALALAVNAAPRPIASAKFVMDFLVNIIASPFVLQLIGAARTGAQRYGAPSREMRIGLSFGNRAHCSI
jgi:hypothetical protein